MKELLNLQEKFQKFLLNSEDDIHQSIVDTKKINRQTRLEIYKNSYILRLIEALASNYPVLQIYLGIEEFDKLAKTYIEEHPSTFRSIRWFGDQLSQFLQKDIFYKEHPYIYELAQFEWSLTLTFDAEDSSILKVEDMQNISAENWAIMKFHMHPSVHLLKFNWNTIAIWQEIMDEKVPSNPCQNLFSVSWVLWRKNFLNQFCSLSEDEAWAIDAMMQGSTFGEICAGLCEWIDEEQASIHAASLLKGWIEAGLINKIKF